MPSDGQGGDQASCPRSYDCASWAYDCPITDDRAITSFSMCTPSEYSDTCDFAFDGECDDGLVGSLYDSCEAGTDLTDCGMPANGNGVFSGPDNVPCEVQCPILMHGAMSPATLYISKGQGSASHPAWASQGAKTVKFRI